jgi:uncharacterized membrane protein
MWLKSLFIGLCVFVILTLVLYYTKSKREREKETQQEIFLRSVLPGMLIGCLVAFFMSSNDISLVFSNFFNKKVYLEEDFYD